METNGMAHPLYDLEVETLEGEKKKLAEHRGEVLLIVNTASKCGLTPQFEELEALHQKYADRGLTILGFPCNQFARQDPGNNQEIAAFCQRNYGVSFSMHAKIDVNGADTHPLYQHLKDEAPGLLGSKVIKWNFTKFLVDRDGDVVSRHAPRTTPYKLEGEIESLLGAAPKRSHVAELGEKDEREGRRRVG